ncbi:MATE family efflux transporter [Limibacterium fermenti]|uniref:MATE family efflux transporter n=1 Tax=Limibacterium fermenti TaxID=3229863 RepID=UPI000E9F0278|nr:MATE family efflux transporter [Porphyromonadaceae bacterium]
MSVVKNPTELGTEKIGKLLIQYAIPAIIAMTASSLYHITDSIFIGHGVGALAISGLAITFPLMNLAAAFGSLVGAGAATLLSIRMGQKDYETANVILGNELTLNVIFGVGFSVVAFIFLDPILYFFGASDATIPYARDFMHIILLGNVVTHMYLGLNGMLRSAGSPEKAMYATIFTVLINLVLNPLFIFVFQWGIKGSAWATVISQTVMLIWQLKFFSNKKNFIYLQKSAFKLHKKIVVDSLSIGLSPFMMNAVACLIVIVINQGLLRTGGDLAVGAYGIVNRIAYLFVMIVMGLNQGMQPIAGYNFGALLFKRVTEVLKKSIIAATCITTFGFLVVYFFPEQIASMFTSDKELIALSRNGLHIVFLTYPIIGFQMVTSNFFQSIGMVGKAIFMSLSRQLLFLLPCLLILPRYWGIDGIWYSMPVADLISSVVAAIMLIYQFRQFKIKEREELPPVGQNA